MAARQLTLRGLDAVQQRHWSVAEAMFREAVEASPHDEEAHAHYAQALWHRQATSEALRHMSEAVRLSGGAPDKLVELGRMHLAVGEIDAAREQAEQAVATNPQYAAAHALLGDVLRHQGEVDRALEQYHWALDIEPAQTAVKIAVAELYQHRHSPRRAIATLQGIALEESSPDELQRVLWIRGLANKGLGRHQDAIQCLAELNALRPDDARILYELAAAHHEAGEFTAARKLAQDAYERDPNLVQARRLIAQLDDPEPHVARADARR